jgi:hypothetical protein
MNQSINMCDLIIRTCIAVATELSSVSASFIIEAKVLCLGTF